MPVDLIPSEGLAKDIEAVNGGRLVVLHRFRDGGLLVMTYDDEIPSGEGRLAASGYVFWYAGEDPAGPLAYAGRAYALVDIIDYALWTDDADVEMTYREAVAKARADDGEPH